jgi:G3E family GTPase
VDTELILVSGLAEPGVADVVDRLLAAPGTAVAHHDLSDVASGVVRRRLRVSARGGVTESVMHLELAHGCVSCTLREDVLPLVRWLAAHCSVNRIVLHLDPVLEPEQVCWAVLHVLVDGRPVADAVRMAGVVTVLDAGQWLDNAASEDELPARGLARLPDDERTVAQLAVAQAEFADLLVLSGTSELWQRARTEAILARLTPLAPRISIDGLDPATPLAGLPDSARRGVPDGPHGALLRGQPPLRGDCGVELAVFTARRPFHPDRLHEAIDLLLDGVVRTRGRIWLATRPEAVLWLESAGGGLQIGYIDQWLAAGGDDAWMSADPERRAAASLRWHPRFGDRVQELTVLTCGADPAEITEGLRAALLTDAELDAGEAAWRRFPDPFGWYHTDPCTDQEPNLPPVGGGHRRGDEA